MCLLSICISFSMNSQFITFCPFCLLGGSYLYSKDFFLCQLYEQQIVFNSLLIFCVCLWYFFPPQEFFFLCSCIYQSFTASQISLRKDFVTHIIRIVSHVLLALLWFYFHIGFVMLSRIYSNVRYKLETHSFFPSVQPIIPNGLFPIDLKLHLYHIIHCFYF